MSEPLERFTEDALLTLCPKCGNDPWHAPEHGRENTLRWQPRLQIHPECVVVSCGRCTYSRRFAPMDAPADD